MQTGCISSQFHIVYNNCFTTVSSNSEDQTPETWSILFDMRREMLVDEKDNPPPLHPSWLEPSEAERRKRTESINLRLRPQPFVSSTTYMQSQTTTNSLQQDNVTNRERVMLIVI